MKRVFVTCHNPSIHGEITWEGHEIVGYVGTGEGSQPKNGGQYYEGWESVPASLKGTMDVVLAPACPVAPDIREGLKTVDSYPMVFPPGNPRAGQPILFNGKPGMVTHYFDMFTRPFRLLKPGGVLLFPGYTEIAPTTKEVFTWKLPPPPAGQERNRIPNKVTIGKLKGPSPQMEEMPEPEPEEFQDVDDEEEQGGGARTTMTPETSWLMIEKARYPVSRTAVKFVAENKGLPEDVQGLLEKYGGRRRKTHRRKRRYSRSSVRKTSKR